MIYCPRCEPSNFHFGWMPLLCCACQEAETGCADDAIPAAVVEEIRAVLRPSIDDPDYDPTDYFEPPTVGNEVI